MRDDRGVLRQGTPAQGIVPGVMGRNDAPQAEFSLRLVSIDGQAVNASSSRPTAPSRRGRPPLRSLAGRSQVLSPVVFSMAAGALPRERAPAPFGSEARSIRMR